MTDAKREARELLTALNFNDDQLGVDIDIVVEALQQAEHRGTKNRKVQTFICEKHEESDHFPICILCHEQGIRDAEQRGLEKERKRSWSWGKEDFNRGLFRAAEIVEDLIGPGKIIEIKTIGHFNDMDAFVWHKKDGIKSAAEALRKEMEK